MALLESMRNEAVVRDDAVDGVLPHACAGFDEAVAEALGATTG